MQDERTAQCRCSKVDSWQVLFYVERYSCYPMPVLRVPKGWDATIVGESNPAECVCFPVLACLKVLKQAASLTSEVFRGIV